MNCIDLRSAFIFIDFAIMTIGLYIQSLITLYSGLLPVSNFKGVLLDFEAVYIYPLKNSKTHLQSIPESRFCETSEFFNPGMRERGDLNSGSVTAVTDSVNPTCSLAGFLQQTPKVVSVSSLLQSQTRCFISLLSQSVSKRVLKHIN